MTNRHTNERRIVLTGASGVGKTSLASLLSQKLELPVIPEIGRELCLSKGYQLIGDIPDQEGFKHEVLAAQIKAEGELERFVSDRSTIDCWVLWQRWNICTAMSYDTESYYNDCRKQAASYSYIIYVPPMFPPVSDGFRWTDKDYQKQIDRLVRMTLFEWNLWDDTYTVTTDNPEQRCDEVLEWLSRSAE